MRFTFDLACSEEGGGIAAEELASVEVRVFPTGSETPAECAVLILASIIRQHKLSSPPA